MLGDSPEWGRGNVHLSTQTSESLLPSRSVVLRIRAWLSSLTAHWNHLGGLKNIDTWVSARDSDILG